MDQQTVLHGSLWNRVEQRLDHRIDELEARLYRRIRDVEARLDRLDKRVGSLYDGLSIRVGKIGKAVDDLAGRPMDPARHIH